MDREAFLSDFERYFSSAVTYGVNDVEFCEVLGYSVSGGGKRVRPLCVYYGAQAGGGKVEKLELLRLAAAVEAIHSYSLIHDDLPAMDNDEVRRGRPSVWKQYGETAALLAGDALLTKAMRMLTLHPTDSDYMRAASYLSEAAEKMLLGQVADLKGATSEADFLSMYAFKTGALIKGAFQAGAALACRDDELIKNVGKFAEHLGLAFQLADDLIDEGEENSIIAVIGRESAKRMLELETEKARSCATDFCNGAELQAFASALFAREK